MKKIKLSIVAIMIMLGAGVMMPSAGIVLAADEEDEPAAAAPTGAAQNQAQSGVNAVGGTENNANLTVLITSIINILLYIIGAVAVIMIVIGGFRYVLSGGDSSAIAGAKNTILYAVIGVVVAILAYAIVNFVIGGLTPTPAP